jgi:hypothetical protein
VNPFNADRPLRAPLFAALAAEVEEIPLERFLADAGRRARVYADLARTLRPDVLIVDSGGDPPLVADLLTRVRAMTSTMLGVEILGPATTGNVQAVIAAARSAAQAGAEVVFVREDVPLPDGYGRLATPLWGSLQFFRAKGVLKAAGGFSPGPYVPCATEPLDRPHALAVPPGGAPPPGHTAVLVTHTTDLAGHVPIRELQAAVARLG